MRAVVALAALGLIAAPRVAAAQHDHGGGGDHHHDHHRSRAWWLSGAVTAVAGSAHLVGEPRAYQGLVVAVRGGRGRIGGGASIAGYRVSGDGVGPGDAMLGADVDLLRSGARVHGGLVASVMLPTGDADGGRGMGHAMLAGGLWLRAARGRATLATSATFARALGDGAEHVGHQHGGAAGWPLVDPMNPSELAVDATATAALVPKRLDAGARIAYAAPVDLAGEPRLIVAAVAGLTRGRYRIDASVAVPLIGEPFVARATVGLGYRY